MDIPDNRKTYESLRRNYLFVYLLASFADWLQGPYLYRLYEDYGYSPNEISFLYVTGFASGTIFGMIVGHCADTFGRKKLCVLYSLTTSISCLATTATRDYSILLVARLFGGASTCILFSTFESWYVAQHLSRYKLDNELMADVVTRSTLYNGMLAVFAGFLSSLLADSLEYGPVAPFLLAIPVSLLSGYSCCKLWNENVIPVVNHDSSFVPNTVQTFHLLLFSSNKWLLMLLGASQSLYETVLYIFVLLWSPILEPMNISQGLIFASFMLCVMAGSNLSRLFVSRFGIKRQLLLSYSIGLGAFSIFCATFGLYLQEFGIDQQNIALGNWICLTSFFLFEVSVGIYYPSVGYLRGIVIPESHRASITNCFRLPMNVFICLVLLYVTSQIPKKNVIFLFCSIVLINAFGISLKFSKLFSQSFVPPDLPKSLLL